MFSSLKKPRKKYNIRNEIGRFPKGRDPTVASSKINRKKEGVGAVFPFH